MTRCRLNEVGTGFGEQIIGDDGVAFAFADGPDVIVPE
jgi:hypothetical protein